MLPTPRTWTVRLAGLIGAALLGAAVAPVPAAGAELPSAGSFLAAGAIAIGVNESTPGKTARLDVFACCSATDPLPDKVTVEVDATPAEGVLVVSVGGADCTASGRVTTCEDVPLTRFFTDADGELQVNLKVAAGAAIGDTGRLRVTVSGAGLRTGTDEYDVQVVGSGADLVAQDALVDANAGETRSFRPTIINGGDDTAKVVGMFLMNDGFTRFTQRFSNCRYRTDVFEATVAYCEFPLNLGPGQAMRVTADSAIQLRVTPDAPHRLRVGAGYFLEALDGPMQGDMGTPGDGPPLELEPFTPDPSVLFDEVDREDNFAALSIRLGPNPTDMSAVGASVSGASGAVVPVTVAITNNGPAHAFGALDGAGLSPDAPNQPAATVTFPQGVEVMSLPPEQPTDSRLFCAPIINGKADYTKRDQPIGLHYRCTASSDIAAGETWEIPFTIKLVNAVNAHGSVVAAGGYDDPDPANNTADIAIDTSGGAGGLPVTGASVGLTAGVGALALLAGAILYLAARRRRIRLEV